MPEFISVLRRRNRPINRLALRAVPRWTRWTLVLSQAADWMHLQHGVTERAFNPLRHILTVGANCTEHQVSIFVMGLHLAEHRKNFCRVQRFRGGISGL